MIESVDLLFQTIPGPNELVIQTLNGLFRGFILFMIASGLTIIFGVLGILNLAHGEFYAMGALAFVSVASYFTGLVVAPSDPTSFAIFAALVLAAVLIAAAVMIPASAVIETVLVRPIYDRDEVYQLLLTFGLLLVLIDVMRNVWGAGTHSPDSVGGESLNQALDVIPVEEWFGFAYPSYRIFAIVGGAVVFLFLLWFFDRTKTGRIMRATAIDREMATAIGVSSDRVFTLVFAMGGFFAGLAGAIQSGSALTASADMGGDALVLSFVVIVVGGLGSIRGAFVGAILVGVLSRLAQTVFPPIELVAPFGLMVLVLLIRPEGLYGTWGEIE
jgi:branched-chain amino acid transport system permease protein